MKRIEAIIREEKLEPVRKALEDIGINSMTVTAVFGRGQQKGFSLRQPRIDRQMENFLPKIRLEVVCHDDDYKMVIEAITNSARTGHIGDGKIFVSTVDEVIRIRTGGTGSDVL